MGKFIGIDLGTTFSAVATVGDTGVPEIVCDEDGNPITPSCVEINKDDKEVLVGEEAKKLLDINSNVIARFKRHMGTDKTYSADGTTYTPEQLSMLVLKKMYSTAKEQLGEIAEAVVTVPANFSTEAREETENAAKKAGIPLKYIINEPTAAALYYAQKGELNDGVYAIFDLGGGTFDVSIIKMTDFEVEVLCSNGIPELGGDDFDLKLQAFAQEEHNAKKYTRNDAEDDKKSLSKRKSVLLDIGDKEIKLERDDFEEMISEYVAQIKMLCESTVMEAKMKMSDLAGVILAGGSTRMPIIKDTVKEIFKKEPIATGNVDQVVALGAAFYAIYKANEEGSSHINTTQRDIISKVKVTDCLNEHFGTFITTLVGDQMIPQNRIFLKKNTKLPSSKTDKFVTMYEGQTELDIKLTACKNEETDPNFVKVLKEKTISGLPGGRPANMPVEITFTATENGVLTATFLDVDSGVSGNLEYTFSAGKTNSNSADESEIDEFMVE